MPDHLSISSFAGFALVIAGFAEAAALVPGLPVIVAIVLEASFGFNPTADFDVLAGFDAVAGFDVLADFEVLTGLGAGFDAVAGFDVVAGLGTLVAFDALAGFDVLAGFDALTGFGALAAFDTSAAFEVLTGFGALTTFLALGLLLASKITELLILSPFESFLANCVEPFSIFLSNFLEPSPSLAVTSLSPEIKLDFISFCAVFLAVLTNDFNLFFFILLAFCPKIHYRMINSILYLC